MLRIILGYLLLSGLLPPAPASADQPCFRIGVPAGAGATGELMEITGHIFANAHLCATMIRLPQIRLDSMLGGHGLDGETVAGGDSPELAELLQAVPTPLAHFTGTLFWPAHQPEPRGAGATIGIILGQEWARQGVLARGSAIFEVRENRQLLEMAQNMRLQGFLLPAETARHFRKDYPAVGDMQSRQIEDLPIQLRMAVRHRDLLPALDSSIIALRHDGYIAQILTRYAQ